MQTIYRFSAPGRTEISGNHTDHQHGCVLAAAVNMQTTAEVTLRDDDCIRVASEGYAPVEIRLDDLSIHEDEKNTTAAIVRGVAAAFQQRGCELRGFDASVRSTVLPGSGLSSSAAFEVLIGTILNELFFDRKLTAVEIAQIGQYAENVYFGKPSGLMDQTASSVGGLVFIDFADPQTPLVERVEFDFAHCGYTPCILDSGADHADLTDEYAAIPQEMRSVARCFGKEVLREVNEAEFYAQLKQVREQTGDRAVLRAMHFFDENRRVLEQVQALKNGDFEGFLAGVRASGRSSWMLLQNIIPLGSTAHQQMALAQALCEKLLDGRGACRVHGGGFAGTILAFVPDEMLGQFRSGAEAVLGAAAATCSPSARPAARVWGNAYAKSGTRGHGPRKDPADPGCLPLLPRRVFRPGRRVHRPSELCLRPRHAGPVLFPRREGGSQGRTHRGAAEGRL